jgi:4,5-dihydroxyphthalate decarboxylase
MSTSQPITLKVNIADYPATRALRDGRVSSELVKLDFCGPKSAHDGFKPMLRDNAYDVSEIAIATYLQARSYGKPYVLMPAATVGRLQHRSIVYNRKYGALKPKDIEGRKVGVRAYTQTTGLWARGVLQHAYGVDLDRVTWVTVEDPHLPEYVDPDNCLRLPATTDLTRLMLDGELAAVILGAGIPDDPDVCTLIPNANTAALEWFKSEAVWPINHMVAVSNTLSRERPDVVREIYRMLVDSRSYAPTEAAQLPPLGMEANRRALSTAVAWAFEQKIITHKMSVEELFDDTTSALM